MATDYERARQELDAILAGLMTEKNIKQSDKRLLATNNRSEEWHNNRKKTFSSIEYKEKRKQQFSTIEHRQKIATGRKKMLEETDWLKNITEANKKLSQNNEWYQNVTEANRKKAQDPIWIESRKKAVEKNKDPKSNYAKSIAKRNADKEWQHKNATKNKLLSSKQCVTPYGVFWSRADAAKFIFENNILPTRKTESSIMSLLVAKFKNNPKEYYYISKEEYIMLTGKDPFNG